MNTVVKNFIYKYREKKRRQDPAEQATLIPIKVLVTVAGAVYRQNKR